VLKRAAIPVLEQVCVEFEGNVCRLKGTDLNVYLSAEIPAEGDDFSFVFRNTASVVRACAHYQGKLEFHQWGERRDPRLTMKAGDRGGEFPVEDVSFYPEFPDVMPTEQYSAAADMIYDRVRSVRYASKEIESKPPLSGVRFEGHHIWCVDGCRLAVSDDEALLFAPRFIIPAKSLECLRAFGKNTVQIAVEKKYVMFSGCGLRLICRQLASDDRYQIENILPKSPRESYWIDRARYLDALKYLRECATDKNNCYVSFNHGTLRLNEKRSDSSYSAGIDTDGSCDISYAYCLKYMKEALEQFAGEEYLRIDVSGETSPLVLSADGSMKALILTARVPNTMRTAA